MRIPLRRSMSGPSSITLERFTGMFKHPWAVLCMFLPRRRAFLQRRRERNDDPVLLAHDVETKAMHWLSSPRVFESAELHSITMRQGTIRLS